MAVGGVEAKAERRGSPTDFKVGGDGGAREGVEDEAFGSDGGALDLLEGVGLDEEEGGFGRGEVLAGGGDRGGGGGVDAAGRAVDEDGGEEDFAGGKRRGGDGGLGDGRLDDAEAGGGLGERDVRAAVGPAAAEGEVDAEAELAGFVLGEVDGVEHGGREEGQVALELEGIDEGELDAADAVGFHLLELAEDLGLFNGGAEPPPADHGAGGGGRVGEGCQEILGAGEGGRGTGRPGRMGRRRWLIWRPRGATMESIPQGLKPPFFPLRPRRPEAKASGYLQATAAATATGQQQRQQQRRRQQQRKATATAKAATRESGTAAAVGRAAGVRS